MFSFNLSCDRLNYRFLAAQSAYHRVLPQNAVGDVFQLCHNSKPRALAPFNEIRLGSHWLTSFCICAADPLAHRKSNSGAKD